MRDMRVMGCVLGAALMLGGCEGSAACIDFADEVLLTALVTDNGERARVEVQLRRAELGAGSIPVKLCAGNELQVDETEMTLVKRPSGAVVHEVTLPSVSTQERVTRRFMVRSGDEQSEFSAAIDAPAFAILAPMAGDEVSRAGTLAINWAPARTGDAKILVKLADAIDGQACLAQTLEVEEPDSGEVLLGAAQVALAKDGVDDNGACAAFVSLARVHIGPLERSSGTASLHLDSLVRATTSRTVGITSVP